MFRTAQTDQMRVLVSRIDQQLADAHRTLAETSNLDDIRKIVERSATLRDAKNNLEIANGAE